MLYEVLIFLDILNQSKATPNEHFMGPKKTEETHDQIVSTIQRQLDVVTNYLFQHAYLYVISFQKATEWMV